ncbi:MAG: tRNA (N6-isopentenyl adenosine(37)-C2)-methylthiotransferase MiaB [Eubacteriales bacterium]|nr:tRNA (N6-isopentenyl adenosine(37)-C2)-methylthiotransferase MiaB [Eubacteriales bacterium]
MDVNFQKELIDYISKNKIKPTCKVVTFGCQMNAKDSEKILGILISSGFEEIDDEQKADFVIYNTCTIRENANQKLYGHIGQLKNSYYNNKNKIIAICGCMMQEEGEIDKIKNKFPFVKLVFGTHNLYKFEEYLYDSFVNKKKIFEVYNDNKIIKEDIPKKRKYSFKCGINISFGCNNFCSYCIVPFVRGREKSRSSKDIINEIKSVVKDGVIEVMLLGQNVNSYGNDFRIENINELSFPELLKEVSKINGLKRIRFMTSHPKDFSDELIEVIKNNKNIARHIHLPVQSGSNKILKLMNRNYSREYYIELSKKIKESISDISLTTDIIVGFPGETEEDFLDTIDLINEVKFSQVFTFEYSKRKGTKAYEMDNQIPNDIVKKRFDKLLDTVEESANYNIIKKIGSIEEVLIESINNSTNNCTARLSNNFLVHFNNNSNHIGELVNVKFNESKGFYYIGELVNGIE